MSEFNTSKNKLRKLWEQIASNTNQIDLKPDDQLAFFNNLLRQQHIKAPIEIYNSGDIFLVPDLISGATTAIKTELMPAEVSYSQLIDIEIPELFLPFIKYSVEIKPIPDTNIHSLYEYIPPTWEGDTVEIRGDNKLIFEFDIDGVSPSLIGSLNGSFTFLLSFFTANNINLDLTKRVWSARIVENDTTVHSGNVTHINTTKLLTPGTGNCAGEFNKEEFIVDPLNDPNHKIINLTSTSFTAVGNFIVTTVTDTGSSCNIVEVTTPDVQKTIAFSNMDDYSIILNNTLPDIDKDDIDTQTFEEVGRWLFWSNLKQKLFVFQIKVPLDGDKRTIGITNLPDTNDGDTLPYTSITLKRNLETATPLPSIQKDEQSSIALATREFKNYVKISEENADIPKYRFKLNGKFIVLSSSLKLSDDTIDFPVYNDIYTVVGTTYGLTTQNHSLLEKEIWLPETQDVIVNIKAHLINPFYWREQRRYDI